MDLFTPPEDSQEVKLANKIKAIINLNRSMLEHLITSHTTVFDIIWEHSIPQDIFDSFGDQAVNMFKASALIQQTIKAIKPDYKVLIPPYRYTLNEDGTVTVGDKIE